MKIMQQEITKLNIKEINKKRKECIRVVLTIVDDAMSYFHIANKTKVTSKAKKSHVKSEVTLESTTDVMEPLFET